MDKRLAEAVEFFKKEKGLHRLIGQVIQKYRRLGDIRGTVRLVGLDAAERKALSELFRKDYTSRESAVVSIAHLAKALERTRFAGVELVKILEGYQGNPIATRSEERQEYQAAKSAFFQSLHEVCGARYSRAWIENVAAKGPGSRGIHRSYDRDPATLRTQLEKVLRALANLPTDPARRDTGQYERLPVFASRLAGDPHGFDIDTEQGKHLIAALSWVRAAVAGRDCAGGQADNLRNNPVDGPADGATAPPHGAEDVAELLAHFGIIRDDLLNFVTCIGILAFDEIPIALPSSGSGGSDGPGVPQPLATWAAACREGAVLNIPLRELVKARSCMPLEACAGPGAGHGAGPAVFVVENSGVFSAILDRLSDDPSRDARRPPMVCTHGQFRLAALMLMDKLAAGGAAIFYSGDFDPEGLQMAQRLMNRFPGSVRPWRYGLQDYLGCVSETPLPENRLAKLQGVTAPELVPAKDAMAAERKAGYQERLLDALAEDVREALRSAAVP
ncbi:MAG: TIGR02679 family protein [Clostridia bacterium]|nr:TIGR02679 family protein [Clostridia bacterium]